MLACTTLRRYAKNTAQNSYKERATAQNVLTFGIMSVQNTSRGNAVFISEPRLVPKKGRGEVNEQNGKNRLGGFDRTVHWSTKFEEYVRRVVNHIRLVVT